MPPRGLLKPVKPAVYLPYTIWLGIEPDLLVRTRDAPLSMLHAVRAEIQSVDSKLISSYLAWKS
ncbi:MAG: hypothetical protein WAM39_19025 [Bryobacteraceae bacterium]